METALSTISVLPSTKEQQFAFFKAMKSEILASDRDPLKILVNLKYIERVIADILKDEDIEHHFANEFHLYEAEKVVTVNGVKLQMQETGVKYDYNASGDPKWFDLDKQITELTEKRKEREKFLQNIPKDEPGIVDSDTGIFITRPPRSSKSKVIVKL
jgi:hypothetical protein